MSNNKNELSVEEKAKSDALRLLAVRPRSVEELRSRLKLKKHPSPAIESVLELLKKQGLLDDEKFARLFAGARAHGRPVGRRQLELDLKKKGLAPRIIENTMAGFKDYDEKEAAREIAAGRFRRMTGLTPEKKKNRIFGFLKRRGFSNDAIYAAMKSLGSEEPFWEGGNTDEG